MAFSSTHGHHPADLNTEGLFANHEPLPPNQSAWQRYAQLERDIDALALPHIEAPWDTRPPLYPPARTIPNQHHQRPASSYYGSSSPLRDFVPPRAAFHEDRSALRAGSTLAPDPSLSGQEASEGEVLFAEIAATLDTQGFSDFGFDFGGSGVSSEDEEVELTIRNPEEISRGSNPTRSSRPIPQPLNMEPPPPPSRNSPSSSHRRTRRRSSTATPASLSNPAPGPSQSSYKRRRTSSTLTGAPRRAPTPTFSTAKSIEQIDLSLDSDPDDIALSSTLGKQRFDAIVSQSSSSANPSATLPNVRGPTKLNTLQCTVCLDTPKDLTATSCGHAFCYACLMDWLVAAERAGGGRSNCPACRKSINRMKKGDVIPLEIKIMRRVRRN